MIERRHSNKWATSGSYVLRFCLASIGESVESSISARLASDSLLSLHSESERQEEKLSRLAKAEDSAGGELSQLTGRRFFKCDVCSRRLDPLSCLLQIRELQRQDNGVNKQSHLRPLSEINTLTACLCGASATAVSVCGRRSWTTRRIAGCSCRTKPASKEKENCNRTGQLNGSISRTRQKFYGLRSPRDSIGAWSLVGYLIALRFFC